MMLEEIDSLVPNVVDVVITVVKNRSERYTYPTDIATRVQDALKIIFYDREPSQEDIIDVMSCIMRALESKSGYFELNKCIKEVMDNEERLQSKD